MKVDCKDIVGHVFGERKPRERQLEFIEACFNAMADRKPIVIEGPTGLGKSLAMICSFMPFVLKGNKRVIYTTRTISQLENFLNELKTVLSAEIFHDISVSLNIGRESVRKWVCNRNSCKGCSCSEADNEISPSFKIFDFPEMKKLFEQGDCPYRVCRFHTSKKAYIVLSTYSKVLNESYRREYMGVPNERNNIILIFDEAHNFFEDVVDKPFIDIGYFEQDTVSDSPTLDLYELKYLLVSSYLKTTSRYVFNKLREQIREELRIVNESISNTRREIIATGNQIYFKQKDIKKKREKIDLIEGTWIPVDKAKIKDFKAKIKDLKKERNLFRYKIDKLKGEIQGIEEEIDTLSRQIEHEYDQINSLRAEISKLYDQKENLFTRIKAPGPREIKAIIASDIDHTKAEIEKCKKARSKHHEVVQELRGLKRQIIEEIKKKNKEKKKYEHKVDAANYHIQNIRDKIAPRKMNLNNNVTRAKQLKESCKTLKKEIKKLEIMLLQLIPVPWDLLIVVSLATAMRRGELLNTTWSDIAFDAKTIKVAPKRETGETWEWNIKDTDRRILPLTDDIIHLLAEHQGEQPSGYPYVFIPPKRYDRIQKRRAEGKWTIRDGLYPLNNFDKQFGLILERAGVDEGEFHDFRRTCISNWLENGMKEYEVMKLAGHASFATTHKFYLAVSKRLVSRARDASKKALGTDFVAHLLRAPLRA